MDRWAVYFIGNPHQERSLKSILGFTLWSLVYKLNWICFGLVAYIIFLFDLPEINLPESPALAIVLFILGAVIEEGIFRLMPGILAAAICHYAASPRAKLAVFLIVGVISSFFFGIAHGSLYNLIFQGVGGLFFWATFSYVSRLGKNVELGFYASSLQHFLFNLIIFFV